MQGERDVRNLPDARHPSDEIKRDFLTAKKR